MNEIVIKILQGSVVTQTALGELTIGYSYVLQYCCTPPHSVYGQKLRQLTANRESYAVLCYVTY